MLNYASEWGMCPASQKLSRDKLKRASGQMYHVAHSSESACMGLAWDSAPDFTDVNLYRRKVCPVDRSLDAQRESSVSF